MDIRELEATILYLLFSVYCINFVDSCGRSKEATGLTREREGLNHLLISFVNA